MVLSVQECLDTATLVSIIDQENKQTNKNITIESLILYFVMFAHRPIRNYHSRHVYTRSDTMQCFKAFSKTIFCFQKSARQCTLHIEAITPDPNTTAC